jgi:serine phosphatase RsbU (regulator of sigma subunit)
VLRYSNAGHPSPLLLTREGELRRLDDNRSPMIGAVPLGPDGSVPGPTEAELTCPAGSLLPLHTDGLTDIAGEDADERADLLERTLARLPADSDAERVVERLLGPLAWTGCGTTWPCSRSVSAGERGDLPSTLDDRVTR